MMLPWARSLLLLLSTALAVEVTVDRGSRRLLVEGRRFFARGVCYSPVPVGRPSSDWLGASDEERGVWARDLELMAAMGVNSVRISDLSLEKDHTAFLDACWAKGILVTISLDWPSSLSYGDAAAKARWASQLRRRVRRYGGHPALLLWAVGDAKNYGLETDGARRRHLAYVRELREAIHEEEQRTGHWHPVCTTLMDQHLSEYFALEASLPDAVDLWCLQLYRGASFRSSLFATYPSGLPMLITEYGADAWDGERDRRWSAGPRDEQLDALVSKSLELREWRSVVAGGMVFSFVDEWWRCSSGRLDSHDSCSAGRFGGLPDREANAEWWGLYGTAPGPLPQARSPRAVVPALTALWREASFSDTTRVLPEADTFVGKWEATSRHGDLDYISTKYHSWDPGSGTPGQSEWNEVGLLRFPAMRPSSCTEPRATVEVVVRWLTVEPLVLAYGPLADLSWAESEVGWESLGLSQDRRRTVTLTSADINERVILDVDGWWSLGQRFGLWLQPDDTFAAHSDEQAGFYSRESNFGPPELAVSCTSSWAEEGWYGFAGSSSTTTSQVGTTFHAGSTTAMTTGTTLSGGAVTSSTPPTATGTIFNASSTTATGTMLNASVMTSTAPPTAVVITLNTSETTTATPGTTSNASANTTAGKVSMTTTVAPDTGSNASGGNSTTTDTVFFTSSSSSTTASTSSTGTTTITVSTTSTLLRSRVAVDRSSRRLLIDGKRFFARGVCYAPVPAGEAAADWLGASGLERSIWERDLELMAAMGVNAVRVYSLSPAKDHAAFLDACSSRGIFVAIALDWPASLSYTDTAGKALWVAQVLRLVRKYKSHPAVLMWGIGNEKNHGSDTDAARRQHLTYVEQVREAIHREELQTGHWHPVCTTLMDLHLMEYFALEADYPAAVDLWCLQLYRGTSFRSSLFATYPSGLPMLITEYGADAWDGANHREWAASPHDEQSGALVSKTKELRDWRSVVAGGMIFAFVDEWWKCTSGHSYEHDTCSVGNFGGLSDGEANEEWWGLYGTSLGPIPQARTPRPAVAALAALWREVSFSATTRLMADADTYVGKWEATSRHGHLEYISTKYHSFNPGSGTAGQSLWNEVGILRFPAMPPSSCVGPRAAVEVFLRWLTTETLVLAYGPLAEASWAESEVSWDSLSLEQGVRRTITLTRADIFERVTLDVEGWWSLGQPFALWLQPDDTVAAGNDQQAGFYSRESHFGPPELAVTCSHSWADEGWYGFVEDGADEAADNESTTTNRTSSGNTTSDNMSTSTPNVTTTTSTLGPSSSARANTTGSITSATSTVSTLVTTTSSGNGTGTTTTSRTTSDNSSGPLVTTTASTLRGTTSNPDTRPCCWWCWWCQPSFQELPEPALTAGISTGSSG